MKVQINIDPNITGYSFDSSELSSYSFDSNIHICLTPKEGCETFVRLSWTENEASQLSEAAQEAWSDAPYGEPPSLRKGYSITVEKSFEGSSFETTDALILRIIQDNKILIEMKPDADSTLSIQLQEINERIIYLSIDLEDQSLVYIRLTKEWYLDEDEEMEYLLYQADLVNLYESAEEKQDPAPDSDNSPFDDDISF